jgi:hypothetical protein
VIYGRRARQWVEVRPRANPGLSGLTETVFKMNWRMIGLAAMVVMVTANVLMYARERRESRG